MKKSIGISLVSHYEILNIEMIKKFNKIIFNWFKEKNIVPTYWGLEGKGFSSKLTKFSNKKINALELNSFLDKDKKLIKSIEYIINPKGSDSPSYDSFLETGIAYQQYSNTLMLYFIINPNLMNFLEEEQDKLLKDFIKVFNVDYGFVFLDKDYGHICAEVLDYDDEKYTEEELKIEDWWYGLTNEEKLRNIKKDYPMHILNKKYYERNINELKADLNFIEIDLENEFIHCFKIKDEKNLIIE